uniref:molybdopterin molybdotransferase MoeA n=1 Tax=Fulvivirga sp. TaxID=1931237 RepID=UPI00404948D0
MISVAEATAIVNQQSIRLETINVPLIESLNRVLAIDVVADRNLPPFNKVAMDGIAIRIQDWQTGQRSYPIVGTQFAGMAAIETEVNGSCIEIMTGASLPEFYDTVIRYEDLTIDTEKSIAAVADIQISKGQNVQKAGNDKKEGEVILKENSVIGPAETAILASVGMKHVPVFQFPKVAIIATGDELVPVDVVPLPYQIRMSNVWAIAAALSKLKIEYQQFHLNDDPEVLTEKLKQIMRDFPIIMLSGGVSKGKADHIPDILAALGVEKLFHRVAQKPGKPFWFGKKHNSHLFFAFPGNPVSTFLCFYKYFVPWYSQMNSFTSRPIFAQLTEDFEFKPQLTYFLQVATYYDSATLMAQPMSGMGSGDFANLAHVDAFLELPAEKSAFKKGEVYPLLTFG